jgi:hypothetical protein
MQAKPSYAGVTTGGGRGGRGNARGQWDVATTSDGRNAARGRDGGGPDGRGRRSGEPDTKRGGGSLEGGMPAKRGKIDKSDRSWELDTKDPMIVALVQNKRNPKYKYCYYCSWPPTGYFAVHKMSECKHNPRSANYTPPDPKGRGGPRHYN